MLYDTAGNCGTVQGHHSRVKQLLRGELQGPEVPSATLLHLLHLQSQMQPSQCCLKHVVLHSMGTTIIFLCLAVLKLPEAAEVGCGLLHILGT